MPAKRYRVRLTAEERKELETRVNTGTGSGRVSRRARILLMADEAQVGGGFKDAEIAKALGARMRAQSSEFGSGVSQSVSKPRSPTRLRNGSDRAYWMVRAKPAWCS